MIEEKRHLIAHGFINRNKTTNDFKNLWDIGNVEPKKDKRTGALKVENDEYYNRCNDKLVHNWHPSKIQEFDEPEELSSVGLATSTSRLPL